MQNPSRIGQTMSRGFTLIELLIVIAIIAILASLAIPAGQSAIDSAKKATAKNQCVQIATAITAYETEYGRLPNFSGSSLTATNLGMLLSSDTANNPRGITFLETSAWKTGKGGTNANGFCDPFNANSAYSVALDTNYSNVLNNLPVQNSAGGAVTTTNLTKHIAVWTIWTNKSKPTIINSWD